MNIPKRSSVSKHKSKWLDSIGRTWMFQEDFPESEEIRQWLESSDWDETLSLVYVYSSRKIVEEYEQLQQDDLGQLIRNDETKTMSIVRIIIRRGFKVMALAELV